MRITSSTGDGPAKEGPAGSARPKAAGPLARYLAAATLTRGADAGAPVGLALLVGLARRDLWRWPRLAAPAVVLALTCVHLFYWTDLRMRAPAVPAVALIAVSALAPRTWPLSPHLAQWKLAKPSSMRQTYISVSWRNRLRSSSMWSRVIRTGF